MKFIMCIKCDKICKSKHIPGGNCLEMLFEQHLGMPITKWVGTYCLRNLVMKSDSEPKFINFQLKENKS